MDEKTISKVLEEHSTKNSDEELGRVIHILAENLAIRGRGKHLSFIGRVDKQGHLKVDTTAIKDREVAVDSWKKFPILLMVDRYGTETGHSMSDILTNLTKKDG